MFCVTERGPEKLLMGVTDLPKAALSFLSLVFGILCLSQDLARILPVGVSRVLSEVWPSAAGLLVSSALCARSLQSCLLLCDPWTQGSCQAALFVEFSSQQYWSGLVFPPPGDLPEPGVEPVSLALAGGFFTTSATWEALGFWHFPLLTLKL